LPDLSPPVEPLASNPPTAGSDNHEDMPPARGPDLEVVFGSEKPPGPKAEKPEAKVEPSAEPVENDPTRTEDRIRSAVPAPEEPAPLTIAELHLCRKVSGFGSFEPLDPTAVKAGQRLLIYCEMTGLEYQPRGEAFLSRLSSHIELQSDSNGSIAWEQMPGTAEDVCRRRRRDYYVNYRIELPRSLEPGSYHLRLTQTDLIANRATSAEIPLKITP
jgi:hypothetical protein